MDGFHDDVYFWGIFMGQLEQRGNFEELKQNQE